MESRDDDAQHTAAAGRARDEKFETFQEPMANTEKSTQEKGAASTSSESGACCDGCDVSGMTASQIGAVSRPRDSPVAEAPADGGNLNNSRVTDGEYWQEPTRQAFVSKPPPSAYINIPPSRFLPTQVPELEDGAESLIRNAFIKHVTKYEGVAVAPSEEFQVTWATMEYELEKIIDEGLVPQDSIVSSGLNEESYKDMKLCAQELQNNLFEGKLFESLSNVRGFRRLFSQSNDPILRHAFRGNPIEVLQNVYYGGDGTLPEDRMLLADPFHHKTRDALDDFTFDD